MLATILTAALMVSAAAEPSIKEAQRAYHAKIQAKIQAAATPAPKGTTISATDTGYVQLYIEEGTTTCSGDATSNYYFVYGECLTNANSNSYTMTGVDQLADGSYNVTTGIYNDNACSDLMSVSQMIWSDNCDSPTVLGGDVYYVEGTSSKFSTPSNSYGSINYNSEADCEAAKSNTVMDCSATLMNVCYDFTSDGTTYSYKQTSCTNVVVYSGSGCTGKKVSADDDSYADDDVADDDDSAAYCFSTGSSGYQPVDYATAYCQNSAASMVSASGVAMFAASALAAFAMM